MRQSSVPSLCVVISAVLALSCEALIIPSLSVEAAAIPEVTIGRSGGNALLNWTSEGANSGSYKVWWSTNPYFTPGPGVDNVWLLAPTASHSQAPVPSQNHYFVVVGVNGVGVESGNSTRTGRFEYSVVAGSPRSSRLQLRLVAQADVLWRPRVERHEECTRRQECQCWLDAPERQDAARPVRQPSISEATPSPVNTRTSVSLFSAFGTGPSTGSRCRVSQLAVLTFASGRSVLFWKPRCISGRAAPAQ